MSVVDVNVVDGCALDKNGCLILMISDHLDWDDEYQHLITLQAKINAYIAFCESGQYLNIYPNEEIRYALIEIHCEYSPTKNAIAFLNQVQEQVGELGVKIECHAP